MLISQGRRHMLGGAWHTGFAAFHPEKRVGWPANYIRVYGVTLPMVTWAEIRDFGRSRVGGR